MRVGAVAQTALAADTVTVHVPIKFARRGGRKLVIAPVHPQTTAVRRAKRDHVLIKMLARANRWRRFLESGRYDSIQALAPKSRSTSPTFARSCD